MPVFGFDWAAGYVSPFIDEAGESYTTPLAVIEELLDTATRGCDPASVSLFDLGSGDGRTVLAASRRGIRAIGIELDEALVANSRAAAKAEGLDCEFQCSSLLTADLPSSTEVVAVAYLLPDALSKVAARLAALQFRGRFFAIRWATSAAGLDLVERHELGGWVVNEYMVASSEFVLPVGGGRSVVVAPSTEAFARREPDGAGAGGSSSASVGVGADRDRLTGALLWDSAIVLSSWLVRHIEALGLPRDATAVELGAGLGLVGLSAAALGLRTTLTDRAELLPLLQRGVAANGLGALATCAALEWGDVPAAASLGGQGGFDLVLLSDCIYEVKALGPLLQTVEALASARAAVLCAYDEGIGRWAAFDAFREACAARGFDLEPIDPSSADGAGGACGAASATCSGVGAGAGAAGDAEGDAGDDGEKERPAQRVKEGVRLLRLRLR